MSSPSRRATASLNRLPGLARQLTQRIVLLLLLSLLLLGLLLYRYMAVPLFDDLAFLEEQRAAQLVVQNTRQLQQRLERLLRLLSQWSRQGLLQWQRPESFNAVMMPLMQLHEAVGSVHLANDQGAELMLLRTADGWRNRLSHGNWQGSQRWLQWDREGQLLQETTRQSDYDTLARPWFAGALATASAGDVYWTEPYIFATTKDPGVTLSLRWQDPESGVRWVVAIDITLLGLSRFTGGLSVGESGTVSLLTDDDRLLGLPRAAQSSGDDQLRERMLQHPADIGEASLARALQLWRQQGRPASQVFRMRDADDEDLIVSVLPFDLGNQRLWIMTLAPYWEMVPVSLKLLYALVAVLAVLLLLAAVAARGLAGAVNRPIAQLIKESERLGQMDFEQPVQVPAPVREVALLAQAQERMRRMLLKADRERRQARDVLEQRVAARTDELHQWASRESSLGRLSGVLQQASGISQTASVWLEQVLAETGAPLAAVFLFDAHAGGYRRLVAIGYSEDGAQRDFSPGHGLVGQAAASGKCTVTCLDGRQRPAVAAGFARLGLDRLYHLPVMHSDGCLAVVEVGAMRELGEPHWLWLQQAAERLSVALIMSAEVEAPSALRASARSPDESLFTASLPDARPDDYGEAAVWRQQGHGAGRSMMVEGDGQCG